MPRPVGRGTLRRPACEGAVPAVSAVPRPVRVLVERRLLRDERYGTREAVYPKLYPKVCHGPFACSSSAASATRLARQQRLVPQPRRHLSYFTYHLLRCPKLFIIFLFTIYFGAVDPNIIYYLFYTVYCLRQVAALCSASKHCLPFVQASCKHCLQLIQTPSKQFYYLSTYHPRHGRSRRAPPQTPTLSRQDGGHEKNGFRKQRIVCCLS